MCSKSYCINSNLKTRILKNKPTKNDKGYELWSANKSNNFTCNNLNNSRSEFESNTPKILNPQKLTVEKNYMLEILVLIKTMFI